MDNNNGFDILDLIQFFISKRKFLLVLAVVIGILSYSTIYFFIDEEFEATSLIIPSETSSAGGLGSMISQIADLPSGLGGMFGSSVDTDLFYTLIYSRTNLDLVIQKFNLKKDYKETSLEKTRKKLLGKISVNETDYNAIEITCIATNAKKAADMSNFIVDLLNTNVIEMNVRKSRDNRIFLEKRYNELLENLKKAEDEMSAYQKKTGLYEAESQIKATFDAYSQLETELATEQIKYDVLEKIIGKDNFKTKEYKISVNEFQKKLNSLKNAGDKENLILPINQLSDKALNYYRLYRNVEIYNAMLKFMIPLYEQARYEEQKDIPVLQVVDKAVPPEKKSYPPRTVLTIIITFFVISTAFTTMFINYKVQNSSNEKLKLVFRKFFFLKN